MKDYRESLTEMSWVFLRRWLGEPRQVAEVRRRARDSGRQVTQLREKMEKLQAESKQMQAEVRQAQQDIEQARNDLEQARDERLSWMAKESSTRKELQDCRERNQELLEQVVELTQLKRKAEQTLLEQKMRTESTPLERNRFEADLAEARARMREAEQRAKRAEQVAARLKTLEKQAARVKELESKLTWEARRADAHQAALAAALNQVRRLEQRLEEMSQVRVSKPSPRRRPYRKPRIRQSRRAVIEA